jgi:hypothetical protein
MPFCESPTAIRKKATVRPAASVDIGVKHENFFIAKFVDSESVQRALRPWRRLGEPISIACSREMRITKVTAAQAFPATSTFADAARARMSRSRHRARCVLAANHALRPRGFRRQHFFKSEAVFFLSLVYSRCSAFDPRVHAASSHLTLEGNMAKKAKKAKKAKSAVKKTAKKTRKVAKKKK